MGNTPTQTRASQHQSHSSSSISSLLRASSTQQNQDYPIRKWIRVSGTESEDAPLTVDAQACLLHDSLWIIGNGVHRLRLDTLQWSTPHLSPGSHPHAPRFLRGHTAVACPHRRSVLVLGGRPPVSVDHASVVWEVAMTEDGTVQWRPWSCGRYPAAGDDRDHSDTEKLLPEEIWGHSAVMMCDSDGRQVMTVFGGETHRFQLRNDVLMLDIETQKWRICVPGHQKSGPSMPSGRTGHSAVIDGRNTEQQNMIIYGGWTHEGYSSDIYLFSSATERWSRINTIHPPLPRAFHWAAVDRDARAMLIFGGESSDELLHDMHQLSLDRHIWSRVSYADTPHNAVPTPRKNVCGDITSDGKLIVLTGGYATTDYQTQENRSLCNDVFLSVSSTTDIEQEDLIDHSPPKASRTSDSAPIANQSANRSSSPPSLQKKSSRSYHKRRSSLSKVHISQGKLTRVSFGSDSILHVHPISTFYSDILALLDDT